jgi:EAL domain-containing protein (putative c-di-GMP-specific phosphodiesterase class I)/GGDEF domain-containing protein
VTTLTWPRHTRLLSSDYAIVAAIVAASIAIIASTQAAASGALSITTTAAIAVILTSALAAVGFFSARAAVARSAGIEARVWRLLRLGLLSWSLGCVPYLAFLATGGDVTAPSSWSQIGFLLAYPFWYRALWLIRQPVLGESRARRLETWAIEGAAFFILALIAFTLLWQPLLPADQNVALLVPVALDLLLLAALYNAVRRSTVTHRAAFVWFAYAFLALAVTDGTVTYLVTRGAVRDIGIAVSGYAVAMGLMAIAGRRPIRVTEAQATLGPSKTILAAIGLAGCGPASALAPGSVRYLVWAVAALLFWRLWALLRVHGQSDTDPLSGFLEPRAFGRHVAGVVQAASSARPALLVAVDLDGFGRWNAQHGYGAGDTLLTDVARRLEASALVGGVWSRLGPDRFAWIGSGYDPADGRRLAEMAREAAAGNDAGLGSRATFVVLPHDAETAANALAAADEGLAAARTGRRKVVAFDRGRLDGVEYNAGYTASLAQRREAILAILHASETITTVFQPIVSLEDGRTVGFEALSRFRAEPSRPPDRWIAEAHAVGLGLDIEVECVRRACRMKDRLPGGAYISVNMSPEAILAPAMDRALGAGSLAGLVIEITEHEAVGDYARLAARLADYRGRGARVAIDDTGAGHASMRHVTQLAPDFIKIDRSLIHDLHLDHAKRALVRSMVTLERELGASVVAEGIESAEELGALRELGVPLGQGFLLARPQDEPTPAPWCAESLPLAGAGRGVGA